jgi:sugar phosphate isomerase/epimerase
VAVGLIDLNPSVRAFHLQRARAFLDLAYDYHADNVLLVIGEYIWNREVIPPAEQWGWAVDSLRSLGAHACVLGLKIVIELEPFPLSLVRDIDTMVRFLDDVGLAEVQANIDVSHLALSKVRPEELRRLKGRAGHVHISDCDGHVHGDLPPGRGVVEFGPYLKEIKDLAIDGAISIELEYSPEPERIVEWVTEAYRATDRLMADHGLRG